MAGGYEAAGRANGLEVRESPAVALLRLGHTPQSHTRLSLGHRGATGLKATTGAGVVVGLLARQAQPHVRHAQTPWVGGLGGRRDRALITGRRRVDLAAFERDRA